MGKYLCLPYPTMANPQSIIHPLVMYQQTLVTSGTYQRVPERMAHTKTISATRSACQVKKIPAFWFSCLLLFSNICFVQDDFGISYYGG